MKNNDKRFFWIFFIIILAVLLIVYLIGQEKQAIIDGGPCSYQITEGKCNVTSIDGSSLSIKFRFLPTEALNLTGTFLEDNYGAVNDILNRTHEEYAGYLGIKCLDDLNKYPLEMQDLENCGIRVGSVFDCEMHAISKGTCTPIIFRFTNPMEYVTYSFCLSLGGEIINYDFNDTNPTCPDGKQLVGRIYDVNCLCICCVPIDTSDMKFCQSDSDCVSASCCHPTSVVNKANAPDCSGIGCTAECQRNTMDCGCGEPVCVNNQCEVSWSTDPECYSIQPCEDSDGGVNYYVQGFANPCLCTEEPCPSCGAWIDYCLNETTLLEYSCENLGGEQYVCPNGCQDGACLGV